MAPSPSPPSPHFLLLRWCCSKEGPLPPPLMKCYLPDMAEKRKREKASGIFFAFYFSPVAQNLPYNSILSRK